MNELFTGIYNRFDRKTLDAWAAINVGGGVVGVRSTGHGFSAGHTVVIAGTDNYDGTYVLQDGTTGNELRILATFAAETFSTSDTVESKFYNLVAGRLYLKRADQKASFPYGVYSWVAGDLELDFTDEDEHIDIQFNLFSQDEAGPEEASDLLKYLKEVFDDCDLTVSGWRVLQMLRTLTVENDDLAQDPPIYGYTVQYTIILEKERT